MTSGDALTKITEWFDRDGLVEQVISQQKEPLPPRTWTSPSTQRSWPYRHLPTMDKPR